MQPSELPSQLRGRPFGHADAEEHGVSADRLRAHDLDRSVWGTRRLGPPTSLAARCELFAFRLHNDVVFSHTTAALLHRAPLPLRLERSSSIHVTSPAPQPTPHAKHLIGHSLELAPHDITAVGDLRVTSAARTWFDLSATLSLEDLVALGDHLIHWRAPATTTDALSATIERMRGRRGVKRAREALDLLDNRAESPPESRLRVILVRAGLPASRVNYAVVSTETGQDFRLDLAYPEVKVVLEYQGDYHRSRTQWRRDMTRRARLEADGWYVIELNADDLRDPSELVRRIRTVLARRRADPWHREFA